MSEVRRECPGCDRQTLHEEYTVDLFGERVGTIERIGVAFITMGCSELATKTVRKCMRCGFKRTLK